MPENIDKPSVAINKLYDASFLKPTATDASTGIEVGENMTIGNSQDNYGLSFSDKQKEYSQAILAQDEQNNPKKDLQMGGFERTGRSFVAGIGDLVDGIGDTIDFLSGTPATKSMLGGPLVGLSQELYGIDLNKPMSDFFHGLGEKIQSVGDEVPGLTDFSDMTFSDAFTLDFWATHGARAIPFTISFLIPGAGGAKAASMGISALSKAGKLSKVGLKAAKKMKKAGLAPDLLTASKRMKNLAVGSGGAIAGNLTEGLFIAGQTLNDGIEQGLSLEQAQVAARDVYLDNMKWMGVDGFQLALFMGGGKVLKTARQIAKGKGAKTLIRKPGMKGFLASMGAVSGAALTDGMLEQYQEVYQDWTQKRRIAEQKGEEFMSYMDYFESDEAMATRVISFASAGSMTTVKSSINQAAERKAILTEKLSKDGLVKENLDLFNEEIEEFDVKDSGVQQEDTDALESSTEQRKAMEYNQLEALMVRLGLEGKSEYFNDFVQSQVENKKLTQEEADSWTSTMDNVQTQIQNSPNNNLNFNEKVGIVRSYIDLGNVQKTLDSKNKFYEEEKAGIENDNIITDKQKKEELKALEQNRKDELASVEELKKQTKADIRSIIDTSQIRREEERVQKEVVPELRRVIAKENSQEELTPGEVKVKADNQKLYETELEKIRLEAAQEKVGNDFTYKQNEDKDNTDLLFTKEGKDGDIIEKRVNDKGIVSERVLDKPAAVEDANAKQEEESKEISAEELAKETSTTEPAEEKESEEDKPKDNEQVEKESLTRRFVNKFKKNKKKGKTINAKNISEQQVKLTRGQRYVWAENMMAEDPSTSYYFARTVDELGQQSSGQAVGLAVFINPGTMTQEVFHHESWHIYQKMYDNTPEMAAIKKEITRKRNGKYVHPIYYKTFLQYLSFTKWQKEGKTSTLKGLVKGLGLDSYVKWMKTNDIAQSSLNSDQNYFNYVNEELNKKGYKVAPDTKQDLITNEAIAQAGGKTNANDSTFFSSYEKDKKVMSEKIGAVWSKIKSKVSPNQAKDIIQAAAPGLYDSDLGEMLRKARVEFAKPNNKRRYANQFSKEGPFHQKKQIDLERMNMESAIENSLSDRYSSGLINKVVNNAINNADDTNQAEFLNDLVKLNKHEILTQTVLNLGRTLGADEVAKIESFVTDPKNAKYLDRVIRNSAFSKLIQMRKEEQEGAQLSMFDEIIEASLESEVEAMFGEQIQEEFSRQLNPRATKLINEFVKLNNKTGDPIKTYTVYAGLSKALEGNRNNKDRFEQEVLSLMDISKDLTLKDTLSASQLAFVGFMNYAKGNMLNSKNAEDSIWHYFRSFKLEKGFQFTIKEDGTVEAENQLPKFNQRLINGKVASLMENLFGESQYSFSKAIQLEKMRSTNNENKNKAILQFVKTIAKDSFDYTTLTEEDMDNISIDGIPLSQYFTDARIDNLQLEFFNPNLKYYYDVAATQTQDGFPTNPLQQYERATSSIVSYYTKSIVDSKTRGRVTNLVTSITNRAWANYNERTDNGRANDELSNGTLVYKGGVAYFSRKNSSLVIKDVFNKLHNSLYYHIQDSSIGGITFNPEGESVSLYNKSAYIYENIENLSDFISDLKEQEQGINRYASLFPGNYIAFDMYEEGYKPEISYGLGIYEEGGRGYKNSNVTPELALKARVLHFISRYKNGSTEYKQFLGQLGDSSRQYYLDNTNLFTKPGEISTAFKTIETLTGKKVDHTSNSEELYQTLLKAGYITESDKLSIKLFYANNYINKYFAQDLFFNKSTSQRDSALQADLPKRLKGISSPRINITGKRIEPLVIKDMKTEFGAPLADSASFMLPETARMLQNQYGELENIGNNLKTLHYGQNLDNTTFEGKFGKRVPIYLKSHTHILTPSMTANNPALKAIEKVLRTRMHKLKGTNAIPIVYFDSSIKGGLTKDQIGGIDTSKMTKEEIEKLTNIQKNGLGYSMEEIMEWSKDYDYITMLEKSGNRLTLENKNKLETLSIHQRQDERYRYEDVNGNTLYGFDGQNFGIQNTLDNTNKQAVVAKQALANLNVINTVSKFKNGKSGLNVLTEIKETLAQILDEQYKQAFPEDFDLSSVVEESVEDVFGFLDASMQEDMGGDFVGNHNIRNKVLAARFRRQAMSIKTNGTLSTEMSDIGYSFQSENFKTSDKLKTYEVLPDGTVQLPEIIISKHAAKVLGITKEDIKKGEGKVFATRIPHSKIGDQKAYVVKEIISDSSAGNMVIIPAESAFDMGSDKDGDQLHINGIKKGKDLSETDKLKNVFLEQLFDLYNQPEMVSMVNKVIEFEESITTPGISHIENNLEQGQGRVLDDLNPLDEVKIQDRFVGNQKILGIAASLNRSFNYFAGARTQFMLAGNKTNIIVNNVNATNLMHVKEGKELWFEFAKLLNFIIDDGKNGDRAKFKMIESTAAHFAILHRTGVPLEGILDIMHNANYQEYLKEVVFGEKTKKDFFGEYKVYEIAQQGVTINTKNGITKNEVRNLVVTLDNIKNDLKVFSRMASLDSKAPSNMFELVALQQQFIKAKENQPYLASAYNNDAYLRKQAELLEKYKGLLAKETFLSENEAKVILKSFNDTLDFINPEASKVIYDSLGFHKLAVYAKAKTIELDGNKFSFNDLLLNSMNSLDRKNFEINFKEGGILANATYETQIESLLSSIDNSIEKLITENIDNDFLSYVTKIKVKHLNSKNDFSLYSKYELSPSIKSAINTKTQLNNIRKSFASLPVELQSYFIAMEFFQNTFGLGDSNQTFLPFLPKSVRSTLKASSKKMMTEKDTTSIDAELDLLNENLGANKGISLSSRVDELLATDEDFIAEQSELRAIKLVELMASFAPNTLKKALRTSTKENVRTYGTNFRITNLLQEETEESYQNAKNIINKNGLVISDKQMFSISYEKGQDIKKYVLNPSRKLPLMNIHKLYSPIISAENQLQKGKDENGNPVMHMKNRPSNNFMFGLESQMTKDAFGRVGEVYLKWNQDLKGLEQAEPAKYKKLSEEYSHYLSSLNEVSAIRDQLDSDNQLRPQGSYNKEYFDSIYARLDYYHNRTHNLHPTAKENILQELNYRFGEVITAAQQQFWGRTEEGERLLNMVSDEARSKDISVGDMMFSPGDFGQNHPTLAAVRRQIETGNQKMHSNLKKVTDELNEAYSALYKEKYGLMRYATKVISNVPLLRFAYSKEKIAEQLFDKLQIQKSELLSVYDEKTKKNINKLINKTELNSKYFTDEGILKKNLNKLPESEKLSEAELNYANLVSRYTVFYQKLLESKGLFGDKGKRSRYVPLMKASKYEIYRRRGIYGLYYLMHSNKDNMYDGMIVTAYNPMTGKNETKTYSEFKAIYSTSKEEVLEYQKQFKGRLPNSQLKAIDLNAFGNITRARNLKSLRNNAKALFRTGKDVLGNPITPVEGATDVIDAENSKTFNRYLSTRSSKSAYTATFNLHQGMYNYLKTMVFQYGTEYLSEDGNFKSIQFKNTDRGKESMIVSGKKNHVQNFNGFENYKFMVDGAMQFLRGASDDNSNSVQYLKDVVMDRFIMGTPKQTITGLDSERKAVETLTRWTMMIGLGLNFTAAGFNIAIGKYNGWRSLGTAKFVKSHMRVFGIGENGLWDSRRAKKAQLILEEYGILTYRPEDQLEDAGHDTLIDKILFFPMTQAEKWIQRTQFVGELSDAQWNSYDIDSNGKLMIVDQANALNPDQVARKVRSVQNVQGRGYSDADQRLIQTYALGSMVMQFKRWFPTYIADRIGKVGYQEHIDDFGKTYAGSVTVFKKHAIDHLGNPISYIKDMSKLSKAEQQALGRFHRGQMGILLTGLLFLMSGGAEGGESDEDEAINSALEKFLGDAMLAVNLPKLGYMATVPAVNTLNSILYLTYHGLGGAEYTRDSKYGYRGEKKSRRYLAALLPAPLRSQLVRESKTPEKIRKARRAKKRRIEKRRGN